MNKENRTDWKRKLTSRKFWTALAGIVMGLALAFGGDGNTIRTVSGAVMSLFSTVTYIAAEAMVDAETKE